MAYPAQSMLAIDASPFGSGLGLLPTIQALRASYPRSTIVAATSTGICELLSAAGLIDEAIDLGVIKPSDRRLTSSLRRFTRVLRGARRFSVDLVLDFSARLETQIASRVFLRTRTVTPIRLPRSIEEMLTRSARADRDFSLLSDYRSVLRQTGIELNDARTVFASSDEENSRFEKRLAKSGSRGGELIALCYASDANDSSGWPAVAFAELAVRLTNNLGSRIVLADEPGDQSFSDSTSGLLPISAIKLVRPRTVELIAAIARASIVITDDPGLANAGSELGTPVVEISGRHSHPKARPGSHRIIEGSSRKRISADEVYEAACELIQDTRSPSLFYRP